MASKSNIRIENRRFGGGGAQTGILLGEKNVIWRPAIPLGQRDLAASQRPLNCSQIAHYCVAKGPIAPAVVQPLAVQPEQRMWPDTPATGLKALDRACQQSAPRLLIYAVCLFVSQDAESRIFAFFFFSAFPLYFHFCFTKGENKRRAAGAGKKKCRGAAGAEKKNIFFLIFSTFFF